MSMPSTCWGTCSSPRTASEFSARSNETCLAGIRRIPARQSFGEPACWLVLRWNDHLGDLVGTALREIHVPAVRRSRWGLSGDVQRHRVRSERGELGDGEGVKVDAADLAALHLREVHGVVRACGEAEGDGVSSGNVEFPVLMTLGVEHADLVLAHLAEPDRMPVRPGVDVE